VQHARICPRGIAWDCHWLPGNTEKRPENSKGDIKSGLGKQVTVPDRAQKDKPKSPQ
jgi:hypothetical protein